MSQTTWLPTLLLIISESLTVYTVKSGSHVTVRPTCPDPSVIGDTCHTLSNLITNSPDIFRVSTIEFHQGNHEVSVGDTTQLLVNMTRGLTWQGNETKDTVITCNSSFAFIFSNSESLTIKSLKFINCGHTTNTSFGKWQVLQSSAALFLADVTSFHMENVVICESKGYSLLGLNLWGTNNVTSSQFLGHNVVYSTAEYTGGNAAFYFYNRNSKPKKPSVTLWITNSTFQDGVDWFNSGDTFTCSKLQNRSVSDPVFKVNGLAIIAGQTEYRVEVQVANTNFSQNTRNSLHPAVWVHDYGGIANNMFRFINCTFEREGTLRISSLENQKCPKMKKNTLCYSKNGKQNGIINHVNIINCHFKNSFHSALDICVKPTYVRYNKFQHISVIGCTFEGYETKNQSELAVIFIRYITHVTKDSPSIAITIEKSRFEFNRIPAVLCYLGQDNYASNIGKKFNTYTYTIILNLIQNCFLHNFITNHTIVLIQAPKNGAIPIWKYENSINDKNKSISRAFISGCAFRNNTSAEKQGTLRIENVYIILDNSTFESSQGTALYALRSVVHIEGFNSFTGNNGTFGGALNLNISRIFVTFNSYTLITNNSAFYGGGIFAVANLSTLAKKVYNRCTISYDNTSSRVELAGNKAKNAGHSIFGGNYKDCRINCLGKSCSISSSFLEKILHISGGINQDSEIICAPSKLCICENGSELCSLNKSSISLSAFPGQEFQVPLVALDELNREMEVVVTGKICKDLSKMPQTGTLCEKDYKNDIGYGQRMQILNQQCTNVTYTVNSKSEMSIEVTVNYEETFNMIIDSEEAPQNVKLFDLTQTSVFIKINLIECPAGFEFKDAYKLGEPSGCKCQSYFTDQRIICYIKNGTVDKPRKKWLFSGKNMLREVKQSLVNRTVVHNSCPYDYCFNDEKNIHLSNPDEQCNFNRTGVLCGACQTYLSIVLGTSNCKKCSNVYLLLIIPFALAGVALVILLLKCNLTVSVGHINGIIFYANIVQVNKALLFPPKHYWSTASQIFSTFIAWLNLDLGIETCFFENMDSYGKVWLQFVFPVYLWLIIALIIILASKSIKLGKLIGNNSVPVLATLFLLSYAKLLRTIIAAVSFTFIVFEDKSYITVWLKNGNVEYFNPEHSALFAVALLFTFLFILPLTLLVLLAPCLQARSHHKAFKWVNSLKPFLDAYQGPYSDKFRFWTGLFLVIRILLFIIDSSNYENDPSMSFFCTITTTAILAFVLLRRAVYRHQLANWIELVSLINIVMLCLVNWLTTTTDYGKWHAIREYATYTSVAVMMIMFLGILLYQLKLMVCFNVFIKRGRPVEPTPPQLDHGTPVSAATSSMVELEECNELKEPLLDSN